MAMAREVELVGSSPGEGTSMAVAMEHAKHAPAQEDESFSSLLKVLF